MHNIMVMAVPQSAEIPSIYGLDSLLWNSLPGSRLAQLRSHHSSCIDCKMIEKVICGYSFSLTGFLQFHDRKISFKLKLT